MKEYSSEYSDSAFKVEDTIVSRRWAIGSDSKNPNISESVRETFTKLSEILEVIPSIPMQNMEGI